MFAVVVRVQTRDYDAGLLVLCVNEIVLAHENADVRQAALERVLEEDEVAGSQSATTDSTPELPLLLDTVGNVLASGLVVDVPGEPGAVEPLW